MNDAPGKRNALLRIFGFIICIMLLTVAVTVIVKPKRLENPYDITRKVRGFYAEPKDSLDFVFVGSSQAFATIVPDVLWEEYGITSYVFGANEQTFSLSYYYIMEALKYQNPKAIVLETTFCNWGDKPRESVVRINFDDMKWGKAKFLGIMNNTEPAEWEYYFFELFKYHSRWDSLTENDLSWSKIYTDANEYKGWSEYGIPTDPDKSYGSNIPDSVLNCQEEKPLNEDAVEWLDKIIRLCEEKQVDLILLKTPNNGKIIQPVIEDEPEKIFEYIEGMAYYNTLETMAKEKGISFLNMNKIMPGTNHNDAANARKATNYIGNWLKQHYEIEDKRNNLSYTYWNDAKGAHDEE